MFGNYKGNNGSGEIWQKLDEVGVDAGNDKRCSKNANRSNRKIRNNFHDCWTVCPHIHSLKGLAGQAFKGIIQTHTIMSLLVIHLIYLAPFFKCKLSRSIFQQTAIDHMQLLVSSECFLHSFSTLEWKFQQSKGTKNYIIFLKRGCI